MLSLFACFIILKAIIFTIIGVFGGLSGWMLALVIIGTLLEAVASIFLGDTDKPVLRNILYYAGLLMQVVPIIVMTVPYYTMSEEKLNFIDAVSIGLIFVNIAVTWFANGFEGWIAPAYMYGGTIIYFVVAAILYAIVGSLHALLIACTVLSGLAVGAIIIGLIVLGNNME